MTRHQTEQIVANTAEQAGLAQSTILRPNWLISQPCYAHCQLTPLCTSFKIQRGNPGPYRDVTQPLFALRTAHRTQKGLILKQGSIVDAPIIHAPSSTQNQERQRDPERISTKKGHTGPFGLKAHGGTDTQG